MSDLDPMFWRDKPLAAMTAQEWEALCDRCGKCCLHKLEDEDSGEVLYTNIACRYMGEDCLCSEYQQRAELVPNCIQLQPADVEQFHWLPSTCAYRLIAEGKPLAAWHPLISGRADSVHRAGISIKDRALNEEYVHPDDFEDHIIHWVE